MNSLCSIFQIYYDQKSYDKLDRGFIPLDNSSNNADGWFEFKPILNYLNNHDLVDNVWYGFLSPTFYNKTGVTSENIFQIIKQHHQFADVVLLHTGWDQICYFKNPWEQGEFWHPGIKSMSQDFIQKIKLDFNIDDLVTDLTSSVFSNYIIAKKKYWMEWKKISNNFFHYMNDMESKVSRNLLTPHRGIFYPMKAFVQERFASLVLANNHFKVLAIDQSFGGSLTSALFEDDLTTRELLRKCDLFKNKYRQTKDQQFLKAYIETRAAIKFTPLITK